MYAYYYDCDPVRSHKLPNYDKLLPDFTQNIAGHLDGMQGLFVASLLCAALSILSPILHTMAGIWYKDCIRPLNWFPDNDANANLAMRIIIFAVGTYCAVSSVLVHAFHSAFQLLNAVTNMTTGAKFGVFTMGLFWPWTNINVSHVYASLETFFTQMLRHLRREQMKFNIFKWLVFISGYSKIKGSTLRYRIQYVRSICVDCECTISYSNRRAPPQHTSNVDRWL